MTDAEIIRALEAMTTERDPEYAHAEADQLLYEWLNTNGHSSIAKAYMDARDRVGFWYA